MFIWIEEFDVILSNYFWLKSWLLHMFKLEQQIVLNDNFESSIPSNNPWKQLHSNLFQQTLEICGQSYKHFIRVNYDTR